MCLHIKNKSNTENIVVASSYITVVIVDYGLWAKYGGLAPRDHGHTSSPILCFFDAPLNNR